MKNLRNRATRDIEILDSNVLDAKWIGPSPPEKLPVMATEADSIEEMIKKMGCAACHRIPTIEFAKIGIIGPLLIGGTNASRRIASPEYQAKIKKGSAHARTPKEYIIESILSPSAFIVPGFPAAKGTSPMPVNYTDKFTYAAVEKLADFLLSLDEDMAIKEGLDRSPFSKEGSLFY